MSADRTMGPLLLNLRQRITLLERRIIRAARGGVPYGVAIPFFGQPSSIPRRYVQPMGQTVSRTTYRRIFEVVGTHYGAGNGSTTFVLPDLRGRALVGLHAGDSDFGALGQRVGAKTHTLTSAQMPSHNHGGNTGSSQVPLNMYTTGPGNNLGPARGSGGGSVNVLQPNSHHTHSISSQGGGGAHNNIQPSFACPWIMRY